MGPDERAEKAEGYNLLDEVENRILKNSTVRGETRKSVILFTTDHSSGSKHV